MSGLCHETSLNPNKELYEICETKIQLRKPIIPRSSATIRIILGWLAAKVDRKQPKNISSRMVTEIKLTEVLMENCKGL